MIALFTLAVFLAAALLFTMQPMAAKMLLPQVGGSPALWNACMVFFQVALLAGYGYAHVLARRVAPRAQIAGHALVLLLPLLVLPLDLGARGTGVPGSSPVGWVLATLAAGAGLPFLVVATSGPLLQRWFSATSHPAARDPYFLYAASNAGSLGGLLLYPFVLEPFLRLTPAEDALWPLSQGGLWAAGYLLFALLVFGCGAASLRLAGARAGAVEAAPTVSTRRKLRWLWLACVPSSALLGTTQYITSDVAVFPLLWVVPLAIYLLSFVLVFSKRFPFHRQAWSLALALLVAAVAVSFLLMLRDRGFTLLPLHLATLLAVTMVCHGRLAAERPPAGRLTDFYLWIAAGGALGGVFNALIAPVVFDSTAEYPWTLFLACLLRERFRAEVDSPRRRLTTVVDIAAPALVAAVVSSLWALQSSQGAAPWAWMGVVAAVVPGLLCLATVGRRLRFALSAGVLLVAGWWLNGDLGSNIVRERTFFGIHRVVKVREFPAFSEGQSEQAAQEFHVLIHGTTRHGGQDTHLSRREIPTSYYHRSGPVGQIIELMSAAGRLDDVAFVGLGAGTLAAYGEPGARFTFYEIDPAVVRIASDRSLFTYLADTKAVLRLVTGDGRLELAKAADGTFDLIVLDAFNSDAVPVHLLTREALALYHRKLKPGGAIAVHLTNWFMRLESVVTAVAADVGLPGFIRADRVSSLEEAYEGKEDSVWAVLAGRTSPASRLAEDPRWLRLGSPDPHFLWTDDYSNLVRAVRWR